MATEASATSVAGVLAERMAERLRLYRACVNRAARGEALTADEGAELRKTMEALGLPSFAFLRDVEAVRKVPRACMHRRRELALNHPHVFSDVDAWVQDRVRTVARRGGRTWCR